MDVGLSTTKILEDAGFADHIVHWLEDKLGQDPGSWLTFTMAIKYYLMQIGYMNKLAIILFTELSFYPDADKKNIAIHVNNVMKLALVKITLDLSIVSAKSYFLDDKTKVRILSEWAEQARIRKVSTVPLSSDFHINSSSNDGKIVSLALQKLLEFDDDRKEAFMHHVERGFKQKQQMSFLENAAHTEPLSDTL